jgi:hypothetical protein
MIHPRRATPFGDVANIKPQGEPGIGPIFGLETSWQIDARCGACMVR